MQKEPGLTRPGLTVRNVGSEGTQKDAHFSVCSINILRRGGVWNRHCKALFRKHVLPLLYRPFAMLDFIGHAVSIVPSYREVTLAPEPEGLAGDGGGEGFRGRCC